MPLAMPANVNTPVLKQFSLAGKTALITGGCRGIGLEIVRGLAEAGANVVLTYTSTPKAEAEKVAADIAVATGVSTMAVKADVRNYAEITSTIELAAIRLWERLS